MVDCKAAMVAVVVAVALVASAHALPYAVVPSKGGIASVVAVPGNGVVLLNTTGAPFRAEYSLILEDIAIVAEGAPTEAYEPYFTFAVEGDTSGIYVFGNDSCVRRVGITALTTGLVVDLSDVIPPGWGGGYAIQDTTLYLTGKYNAIRVDTTSWNVTGVVALSSEEQEPLCATVAGDYVYFGLSVGHTRGFLAQVAVANFSLVQKISFNGSGWPFDVSVTPDLAKAFVFTTHSVVSLELPSLTNMVVSPAVGNFSEMMCTDRPSGAVVVQSTIGWLVCDLAIARDSRDLECIILRTSVPLHVNSQAHHACALVNNARDVVVAGGYVVPQPDRDATLVVVY